ncbi:hypothetical protein GYO_2978 [Bacillus spizizenii TU-B-10]|uniref:Uncharacterized protein n=1 Tax=Bacillus spizizenii (strain DSM 15029 / JCM 12233 / NBRC 101239 / NRRL B-23049 / TU-B-10) TaxID=1052585 RepID=G4NY73_BACS4|nr:hypothetical protein GYO_2978 [Bacillus spizizenii TU-B-10]
MYFGNLLQKKVERGLDTAEKSRSSMAPALVWRGVLFFVFVR